MTDIKTTITTVTQTTRKCQIELTGEQIAQMLRNHPAFSGIPANATISFHVPGGGDWSHMSIDIDDENPVYVEWKTESVEIE